MLRTFCCLLVGTLLTACGPNPEPEPAPSSGCDPTSYELTSLLDSRPAEALLQLNCYRARMDANLAVLDASLNEAAQLHAEYLAATGAWGHGESDSSQPSYRAESPAERAELAGFSIDDHTQSIAELIGFRESGADASAAVDLWFDTVYHRLPLAIPQLQAVGFGSAGIYDVMLVVSPWESSEPTPDHLSHVYPTPGQTQVPRSFDSDREVPDPAPDQGIVGFPISISFLDQSFYEPLDLYDLTIDAQATELRDSTGDVVPSRLLVPSEDELLLRSAVILPDKKLDQASYYSVRFIGTVGGTAFSRSWSFETQ